VTYSVDLTNCDGRTDLIINTRTCSVPITTLIASPFSLTWGSSVYTKVIALNAYGTSSTSLEGNGAVILMSPDTPLNLAEIVASKTSTSISLQWDQGVANGGSAVIDYRVNILV
jgi:hypothetical protein